MGLYYETDPATGGLVPFRVTGDAPTQSELDRIRGWQQSRTPAPPPPPAPEPVSDDVNLPGTAIGRGLQQAFYGTAANVGSALQGTGIAGLEDAGTSMMEFGQEGASGIPSIPRQDVDTFGEALTFGGQAIAQGVGSTVGSLAGFGLGAAVGGPAGAVVGGSAVAFPQLYGQNRIAQMEADIAAGRPVDVEEMKALAVAAPQTALELVLPGIVGKILQRGGSTAAGIIRNTGKAAGEGFVAEGLTELSQDALSLMQAGVDLTTPEAQDRLIDAFIVGSLSGGAIGGGVGAYSSASEKKEKEKTGTAITDIQAEAAMETANVKANLKNDEFMRGVNARIDARREDLEGERDERDQRREKARQQSQSRAEREASLNEEIEKRRAEREAEREAGVTDRQQAAQLDLEDTQARRESTRKRERERQQATERKPATELQDEAVRREGERQSEREAAITDRQQAARLELEEGAAQRNENRERETLRREETGETREPTDIVNRNKPWQREIPPRKPRTDTPKTRKPVPSMFGERRGVVKDQVERETAPEELVSRATKAVTPDKAKAITKDVKTTKEKRVKAPKSLKQPTDKRFKVKRSGTDYVVRTPTEPYILTQDSDGAWYGAPESEPDNKTYLSQDAQSAVDEVVSFQQQFTPEAAGAVQKTRDFIPEEDVQVKDVRGRHFDFGEDGPFTRVETPLGEFRLFRDTDQFGESSPQWFAEQVSGDPVEGLDDAFAPGSVTKKEDAVATLKGLLSGKKVTAKSASPNTQKPSNILLSDEEVRVNNDRLQAALEKHLAGMGFSDVKLTINKLLNPKMFRETGVIIRGEYDPSGPAELINVATQWIKPNATDAEVEAALVQLLNHEVIHAARPFFTPSEWATLTKAVKARKYVGDDGKARSYTYYEREQARNQMLPEAERINNDRVVEEAVAELFKDVASGKTKLAGAPKGVWERFKNFMKNLVTAGREYRRDNPQEVLDRVTSGEVGGRRGRAVPFEERNIDVNQESVQSVPLTDEGVERAKQYSRLAMDTDAFKRWNEGNAVRDEQGKPVVLYRTIAIDRPEIMDAVMALQPNEGYAIFASENPYVSATYGKTGYMFERGGVRNVTIPFFVKANKLTEWIDPRDDMQYDPPWFELFDEFAVDLAPGEVGVARKVYDDNEVAPGYLERMGITPDKLTASDTYTFTGGVEVRTPWDFIAEETNQDIEKIYSQQAKLRSFSASPAPGMSVNSIKQRDISIRYAATQDFIANALAFVMPKNAATETSRAFYQVFLDKMMAVGKLLDNVRAEGITVGDALDAKRTEENSHGFVADDVRANEEGIYLDAMKSLRAIEMNEAQVEALRGVSPQFQVYEDFGKKQYEAETVLGRAAKGLKRYFYGGPSTRRAVADTYLTALHAVERNDFLRAKGLPDNGSGMTLDEANAIKAWARSLSPEQQQALNDMADKVQAVVRDTNERRLDTGLINKGMMQNFKYYVPLRGIVDSDGFLLDDTVDNIRPAGEVTGREDPSMTGRVRETTDANGNVIQNPIPTALSPLANAIVQNQQTIVRGGHNTVNRSFADMLRDPVVGKAKSLEGHYVTDKAKTKTTISTTTGKPLTVPDQQWVESNNVIRFKEDGVQKYIYTPDDRIGRGFNGVAGPAINAKLLESLRSLNRFLSNVNTTYNPDFAFPNLFRDTETALVNATQYNVENVRTNMLKNMRVSFRPLAAYFIKGERPKVRGAPIDRSVPFGQATRDQQLLMIEDFMANGGKNTLNQMGEAMKNMSIIDKDLADIGEFGQKPGSGVKLRRLFGKLGDKVSGFNEVFENVTRFAFYEALVREGATEQSAANAARNLTTNFTAGGTTKQLFNSTYLFYNASLQGSMALINASTRSRKAQKALLGIMGLGVMMDQMLSMLSEEDEDGVLKYDKLNEYDLEHNIIIPDVTGYSERGYFKIPMAYGLNLPFNVGRAGSRWFRGAYRPDEVWSTTSATLLEAFNPFGDNQSVLAAASPTVIDPFIQLGMNENYANTNIYREKFPSEQSANSHLVWTTTSATYATIAQTINEWTGGTPVRSGFIDINPEVMEFYVDFYTGALGSSVQRLSDAGFGLATGEPPTVDKIPVLRRLVGQVTDREDINTYRRLRERVLLAEAERENALEVRDMDRFNAARQRYREELKVAPAIKNIENQREKIQKQINELQAREDLTNERKAELLDRLTLIRQRIVTRGIKIMQNVQ